MEQKNEEIEKIYEKVRVDWKLKDDLISNFINISLVEFGKNRGFPEKIEIKALEEFSEHLVKKIVAGLDHYLGKFGEHHLELVLNKWIKIRIDEEISERVKNPENGSVLPEFPINEKKSGYKAGGGLNYIH